jgi:hypothetical protein
MHHPISDDRRIEEIHALRTRGHFTAARVIAEDRLQQLLAQKQPNPDEVFDWTCRLEKLSRESGWEDQARDLRSRAVEMSIGRHGASSRETAATLERLAEQMIDGESRLPGRWETHEEALALLQEASRIRSVALTPRSGISDALNAISALLATDRATSRADSETSGMRGAIACLNEYMRGDHIATAQAQLALEHAQTRKILARASELANDSDSATWHLQRAISCVEEFAGKSHTEVARCLCLLSRRYRLDSNFDSSIRIAREALRIAELSAPRGDGVVDALHALGLSLVYSGNVSEGMDDLRRSSELSTRAMVPATLEADVGLSFGRQLLRLDRFQEASRCLLIAANFYQATMPPTDQRRIYASALLGRSLAGIGDVAEARRWLHRASLDAESLRSHASRWDDHAVLERFAETLIVLVYANADAEEYEESDRLLTVADEIASDFLGVDAESLRSDYEYRDEAEEAADESIEQGESLELRLGPAMAMSLIRRGDGERAVSLIRRLLEFQSEEYRPDDPMYMTPRLDEVLSLALLSTGDKTGAVNAAAAAVAAREGEAIVDQVRVANLLSIQAAVLQQVGRTAESDAIAARATDAYKRVGHACAAP